MEKNSRIYQIDNIRFILIFLVVFGHLCEQVSFKNSSFFYVLIYSFHMPAFSFISGYCCKKIPGEKLVVKYLYPYFVFQTGYIIFDKYILHKEIYFQYTTPYWLLWYLLALFFWNLIISVFSDTEEVIKKLIVVSIILAFVIGYDSSIAYYLSLSRVLVMFPFYICGYYIKIKGYKIFEDNKKNIPNWLKYLSLCSAIFVCYILYRNQNILQAAWAYHSQPYQVLNYNIWTRICFMIIAIVFITLLCIFVSGKKWFIITEIGQNTLSIFLLHGFILRYLAYKNILQKFPYSGFTIVVLSIIILWILSRKIVNILLYPFINWLF